MKTKRRFYIFYGKGRENEAHIFVGFIEPPYVFDNGKYIDNIRLEVRASNRKRNHCLDMTREEAEYIGNLLTKISKKNHWK